MCDLCIFLHICCYVSTWLHGRSYCCADLPQKSHSSSMAPPQPRKEIKKNKNHKFMVKVLVPPNASATMYDLKSYQEWMKKNKTRKRQNLNLFDFPADLLERILEGLSSADRIRFGATCKKNLSFVTTEHHHHQYEFRMIDKLPWLATFDCFGLLLSERRFVFRLFEPLHQRGRPHYATYEICNPNGDGPGSFNDTRIKASKKGWFLCLWPKESPSSSGEDDGMTCFLLFSPFNKRVIKLPDLDHYFDNKNNWMDQLMCRATFSSHPSSPDCVYFFLSQDSIPGNIIISTLRRRSRKWKTKVFDKLISLVSCVVYHEGCFYCISCEGQLAAYNIVLHNWEVVVPSSPLPDKVYSLDYDVNPYLVVCEGKLILVFLYTPVDEYNNVGMIRCGLFEFSSSTRTWVERTSLGNHALFLGGPTSFSVPVPSWSNVANRMYFYRSMMDKACLIYYSLKDGCCHLSEDGSYWSSVDEFGMWMEPLSSSEPS